MKRCLLGAEDSKRPAYLALQPMGLIPALETPDGVMFETAAILLWLADRHGALAPTVATPDRARFLTWYMFVANNIHAEVMQLYYAHRVAGEACTDAARTHARARMQRALATLDTMVAKDRPAWLAPDQPSILGYYLCTVMRWMNTFEGDAHIASSDYPALHAILLGLQTRPAALRSAKAEELGAHLFTASAVA